MKRAIALLVPMWIACSPPAPTAPADAGAPPPRKRNDPAAPVPPKGPAPPPRYVERPALTGVAEPPTKNTSVIETALAREPNDINARIASALAKEDWATAEKLARETLEAKVKSKAPPKTLEALALRTAAFKLYAAHRADVAKATPVALAAVRAACSDPSLRQLYNADCLEVLPVAAAASLRALGIKGIYVAAPNVTDESADKLQKEMAAAVPGLPVRLGSPEGQAKDEAALVPSNVFGARMMFVQVNAPSLASKGAQTSALVEQLEVSRDAFAVHWATFGISWLIDDKPDPVFVERDRLLKSVGAVK